MNPVPSKQLLNKGMQLALETELQHLSLCEEAPGVPGLSKASDTSYQALATFLSLLEIMTSVGAQGTSSHTGFLRTVSQAEAGLLG